MTINSEFQHCAKQFSLFAAESSQQPKNPRLLRIHLCTFRNYFAKKELLGTTNMVYVQYLLGHKSSASTDRYTKFKDYALKANTLPLLR